ncbi:MAG: hypothetical protein WAO02_02565 [Verrucomicrobiia bacterium]
MAKAKTVETDSAYYPPRARWYSPLFHVGGTLQQRLALDRLRACLPREMALGGLMAAFLVPGLGFYLRGSKLWGKFALAGGGLLILAFIAGFGYRAGNFALGLLIAVHATGFVYYCSPFLGQEKFGGRLGFTLLAVLAIGLLFYLPMRNIILQRWVVPLRVGEKVIIVHRQRSPDDVKRGDWVMYSVNGEQTGEAHNGGAVWVQAGFGWGPVLAVGGDRVEFSTNAFRVHGEAQPLLPHMPTSGELVVPEKHWFVWPEFDISGHGNVGESAISAAIMQLATVSEKQFIGKPFARWLWRRQITP